MKGPMQQYVGPFSFLGAVYRRSSWSNRFLAIASLASALLWSNEIRVQSGLFGRVAFGMGGFHFLEDRVDDL